MKGYLSSLATISIRQRKEENRKGSIECMHKAVSSGEACSQQPGSQTLAATASVLTFLVSPPVQLIEQHIGRH